ncbi:hypothetical protein POJ06DRAFT_246134 [Lipomyces tetrasporus]|uniref:Dicer-like protein 1 n=1 Tax=Lipomyces tetrasporus TaxID=54092 RepID=A0AAD7QWV6_9ASCO|nr:uncharacterized protein POJ06DRAFT_246134 [Lipomyces tetrasporus]KAJ8102944.1 hypothetical protein POJ06DRAFT_246134 [Lipomyces tetrasporus]
MTTTRSDVVDPIDHIELTGEIVEKEEPKYIRIRRQKETFDRWFERQSDLLANREESDSDSDLEIDEYERQREKIVRKENDDDEAHHEITRQKIAKRNAYISARDAFEVKQVAVSEPRDYQLELFECATESNVIAVLDTGSGKTLIACLLMKHILEKEQERREKGEIKRIALFLVNSVTLVFQQSSVISVNVPFKVAKFCGQMGVDYWDKDTWVKYYEENEIFVMTADILYNCLTFGYLSLNQVCLLVFDECHHAKGGHVFLRIMTEFYRDLHPEDRPRVFGMTASPVDAKLGDRSAALALEAAMDGEIRTTRNLSLLRAGIARPVERVMYYNPSSHSEVTELYSKLYRKFGILDVSLKKVFLFAEEAAVTLGPWCADQVWLFILKGYEPNQQRYDLPQVTLARRQDIEAELTSAEDKDQKNLEREVLAEVRKILADHKFTPPSLDPTDLSDKVLSLLEFVAGSYKNSKATLKCIIFVERRYTAWILYSLLRQLKPFGCKPGVLTGHGDTGSVDFSMAFREQSILLYNYRNGKVNCLVATSVAEEGLDMPDCNLIIRFDNCKTMIQYVQSRGRARQDTSLYIHMVERNNLKSLQSLSEVSQNEKQMRQFCEQLPQDRILEGIEDRLVVSNSNGDGLFYIEPSTGARISSGSALMVLANYVSALPHDGYSSPRPMFHFKKDSEFYTCTITMPATSGILTMQGERRWSKSLAKRDAAFRLVVALRKADNIDEHFCPYRVKKVRLRETKKKEISADKTNSYPIRSADFWKPVPFEITVDEVTHTIKEVKLYMTVFDLPKHVGMYRPLCFLCRKPHPQYYSFALFVDGEYIPVECKVLSTTFTVSTSRMGDLARYTVRLFHDVFNKLFDEDMRKFPYYLAPYSTEKGGIDWDLVDIAKSLSDPLTKWETKPDPQYWLGKFVVDERNRNRRFELRELLTTLDENSSIPSWYPSSLKYPSIKCYTYSSKQLKGKESGMLSQPVYAAKRILHGQNFLKASAEQEGDRTTDAAVIPGPFYVSTIDAATMWTTKLLPSIMFHIESCVQATELCSVLDIYGVNLRNMVEAITVESAHLDLNYERLEVLGDAFLKASTSIALFIGVPQGDEYTYHIKRLNLICNQNMYETALEIKLYEYLRATPFNRRAWYPDHLTLLNNTKSVQRVKEHVLGDKALADVCEALIGASFLEGFDKAVHAVSQIVRSEDHDFHSWRAYADAYVIPDYQKEIGSAADRKFAEEISDIVGYKFRSPLLIRSAFTHSSCSRGIPSYQRLEFLGDALFELLCVQFLYNKYPEADPQYLTEHKMPMVSNKFLGYLSVKLGLYRYLDYVSSQLPYAIQEYVEALKFEEQSAADENKKQVWMNLETPKPLADCVEATLGAVLIDSDFDFAEVQSFFDRLVRPYFEDFTPYETYVSHHPTTLLAQLCSDVACNDWKIHCREYKLNGQQVVLSAVQIHGRIIGSGEGVTIKNARFDASKNALKWLQEDAGLLEKLCTCKTDRIASGLQSTFGKFDSL